jgi:hypothetical protein
MSTDTDRIAMLNDELRQHLPDGAAVITPGVAALGPKAVQELLNAVASYDNFDSDNDPHGEHDFGALDFQGQRFLFKIDYYDKARQAYSPDPADPLVTDRVITIMRADEY